MTVGKRIEKGGVKKKGKVECPTDGTGNLHHHCCCCCVGGSRRLLPVDGLSSDVVAGLRVGSMACDGARMGLLALVLFTQQ
jgi:hypothetical protein